MSKESIALLEKSAITKSRYTLSRVIILSILAGFYVSIGGVLSITVSFGFPGITAENPALQKLLSGAVFPIGLMFVVLAGANLFTGNTAVYVPPILNKKLTVRALTKGWGLVYIGNFIGAVAFAYFVGRLITIYDSEPWLSSIIKYANYKVSLEWGDAFYRGIACNWLVCLAIYLSCMVKDTVAKIVSIWIPTMCFVVIGFEHSVANMFFIPLGILKGADITITQFLLNNLLPVTIGNIIGGALFVGTTYWYVYKREPEVD